MAMFSLLIASGLTSALNALAQAGAPDEKAIEFPEYEISEDSALAAQSITYTDIIKENRARLRGQDKDFGHLYKVAIGDVLFSEFDYTVKVSAKVLNDVRFDAPNAKDAENHLVLASDRLKHWYFNPQTTMQFCTTTKTGFRGEEPKWKTCFNDKNKDLSFDQIQKFGGKKYDLQGGIPYRMYAHAITGINGRYELIFLGTSGDSIRVAYREYANEMARPAFSNDLTFPYTPGQSSAFRYKDLRFEVSGIDGEGISYRVTRVPK